MRNKIVVLFGAMLVMTIFTGCGPKRVPFQGLTSSEYQEFAQCPTNKCWLMANDSYIAVGAGRGARNVSIYDADNLKKLTTINDVNVMKREYGLSHAGGGGQNTYRPLIETEIKGTIANINFLGEKDVVRVDLPNGYQKIASACRLSADSIAVVFVTKEIDRYLLAIFDQSNPANNKTLKEEKLPYIHRNIAGKVFNFLSPNKIEQQWHSSLSIVPGIEGEKLYLGISSLNWGCSANKCKNFEARSNFFVIDFEGNTLGEINGSNHEKFISYGRLHKVAGSYFIPREPRGFNTLPSCVINPETGLYTEIENPSYLQGWNKNNFFYSPDGKQFLAK